MTSLSIFQKTVSYLQLMRFNRPIGTLLLLWPTLWSLWIAASGFPPSKILIIFIAGVIVMRAAGCVINDFADRKIDAFVARTNTRPLVTKVIAPKEALLLFSTLCAIGFTLVLFLNKTTVLLSLPAVVLAIGYPFAKRYFSVPQFVLGIAFSWSIIMSFSAVRGAVPLQAWLLFGANFCWIVAYDTQYALVDREDDLKAKIKSSAIFFGRYVRLWVCIFQLVMIVILAIIGIIQQFNLIYFFSLLLVLVMMAYQFLLVFSLKSEKCFRAFLSNNWIGFIIFFALVFNFSVPDQPSARRGHLRPISHEKWAVNDPRAVFQAPG